VYLRIKILHV